MSILLLIVALSAPINLALTTVRVQNFAALHRGLTTSRRIFLMILAVIGILLATIFLFEVPTTGLKLFSLLSIIGNIYSLIREFRFSKKK